MHRYSLHGFDAVIASGVGIGVPLVDRGVVLHARVGAAPCRLGDLAHQLARGDRLADRLAGAAGDQPPLAVLLDRRMNSSVTRTELFAFWYWIEWKPSPSIDMSKPASRRAAALSSSLALH